MDFYMPLGGRGGLKKELEFYGDQIIFRPKFDIGQWLFRHILWSCGGSPMTGGNDANPATAGRPQVDGSSDWAMYKLLISADCH